MKIRMQIGGFEVKLRGPVEGLARVVEACSAVSTKVYDLDYVPIVFTTFCVKAAGEYLVAADGPVRVLPVAEVERVQKTIDAYNAKVRRIKEAT